MIVPEEDEEGMQYFDDDLHSVSSQNTVVDLLAQLSDEEEEEEGSERLLTPSPMHSEDSAIDVDAFTGFKSLLKSDASPSEVVLDEYGFRTLKRTGTVDKSNDEEEVTTVLDTTLVRLHAGGGDANGNVVEVEEEKVEQPPSPFQQPPRSPEVDVFGRATTKGRSNWFTSEYGSIFRLMDGDLVPREMSKPARKATSDVKYIRQLYSRPVSISELAVGEGAKRISWGTFFKGDEDAWNVWNSETELSSLTTLDVQRNVAAAVNSRRKMKWAIGVERNGMVTGVALNEEEKDILRQAVDFALSREFVPELDPRIVKLEFVKVSAVTGNRHLVLITINSLVESLHQLSSGRIFYLIGDRVVMAESINQIRLALEERARYDARAAQKGLGESGKGRLPLWAMLTTGTVALVAIAYALKRYTK